MAILGCSKLSGAETLFVTGEEKLRSVHSLETSRSPPASVARSNLPEGFDPRPKSPRGDPGAANQTEK